MTISQYKKVKDRASRIVKIAQDIVCTCEANEKFMKAKKAKHAFFQDKDVVEFFSTKAALCKDYIDDISLMCEFIQC